MKILFIQNRLLFPANVGGKLRSLNVVRHLARWHEVTYLCNLHPEEAPFLQQMHGLGVRVAAVPRSPFRSSRLRFWAALALNLASSRPFHLVKHHDPVVSERARELHRQEPFDLVVCDFLLTALHAMGLPGVPRVLFQHNVEAQVLRRYADASTNWLHRGFVDLQWRRLRRYEAEMGAHFDTVIAVSNQDREHFEREYGWRHVSTIDTAVDLDYFQPVPTAVERAGRVLFLGSMDWLPNQDGVKYFVRDVWPLVRQHHPQATFQIVGRNPPTAVRELGAVEGVEVVGTVPDVRPYLGEAEVVVVPLLVGGGTRLKIFEAMAMGKAVVSTTIGCEGLPVLDDRHLIVEDEPQGLARAVCGLLDSPTRRAALGDTALALVRQRYGAEVVARQFDAICQETVARAAARRAPSGVLAGVSR